MVFSSILFLLYFLPFFLLVYHLTPAKWKNATLLISSIIFYAWGAPKFIFVILGTTFLDFHLVRWMDAAQDKKKRRLLLLLSLSLNLGLLFYFKYYNFFISNVNSLLEFTDITPISITTIILPIGISFYTFESITFVVDVYRKVHAPLKSFWHYQLYIILFPKLIAGPIIRYHEIADQIADRSQQDTIDYKLTGMVRFIIGLSKKVLIANVLGVRVDEIFLHPISELSFMDIWIGAFGYTFQIYFDFCGYSDMAIGLGKILGFRFPENFNNPYVASSITEFWRRWHMTLGAWMKNYLYIPLGGNRTDSKLKLYFNLWIVFLVSGLWHGPSWNFIIWGAYHGFFLVLERAFLLKIYSKISSTISMLITFFIVTIGWLFFRTENIDNVFSYIEKMMSFDGVGMNQSNLHFNAIMTTAVFFSFITVFPFGKKLQDFLYRDILSKRQTIYLYMIILPLLVLCISSITGFGFNPFIYFRF